jgi:hypothetical protein
MKGNRDNPSHCIMVAKVGNEQVVKYNHNCTFPFASIHGWYICMPDLNNDVEIFSAAIFRGRNSCSAARRIKGYNCKPLYLKPFTSRHRPTLFVATRIKANYSPRKK